MKIRILLPYEDTEKLIMPDSFTWVKPYLAKVNSSDKIESKEKEKVYQILGKTKQARRKYFENFLNCIVYGLNQSLDEYSFKKSKAGLFWTIDITKKPRYKSLNNWNKDASEQLVYSSRKSPMHRYVNK